MPLIAKKCPRFIKSRVPFWGMILLLIFLSSCGQKADNDAADKPGVLFDKVNAVYDHNPAKGIRYLDSAIATQRTVSFVDRDEYYFTHYFYCYRTTKNYKMAMLYADSMLQNIANSSNEKRYTRRLARSYFSKGDVYFVQNNFPEAYQCYYKGKTIAHNNLDNCNISDYSYHMGMIMYKQEHYNVAASHFIQAFTEIGTCNTSFVSFYRAQELLDNVAISYNKAGKTDSAGMYFKLALDYINKEAPKYPEKARLIEVARGVVYGNQARLYIIWKKYDLAKSLLKKSIAVNLIPGNDNRDAQLSELKLAHLYADNNNPDSLVAIMSTIRTQLDTINNGVAEVDWNFLMAKLYQKKKDAQKALGYFNRYDLLKDSLFKANQKLRESDVVQQFKDFDSQSTISTLKSDNEAQHMYLTIALVYAVMALVIILLIFLNWKRSRKNVKELSALNETVNEQKQQLERSLAELEDNSHEKDRILRAVSHDLRNPIGGIASLTAMMLMEPNLDGEHQELLQLIQTTTDNSLELINEILEATGINTPKNLHKQYVDINMLLSHSVELLRFKAAEKNQKIMLDVLESPEELYISREKIWRVLSNLISNAIKFSPQGAVIGVKVSIVNNQVQIAVNDHGIGIPAEIKNKVFNMFTEARRLGTNGEQSFGLGLSISKQIIESHGGEIWFESETDKGTTFYVRLKKTVA